MPKRLELSNELRTWPSKTPTTAAIARRWYSKSSSGSCTTALYEKRFAVSRNSYRWGLLGCNEGPVRASSPRLLRLGKVRGGDRGRFQGGAGPSGLESAALPGRREKLGLVGSFQTGSFRTGTCSLALPLSNRGGGDVAPNGALE